LNDKAQLNEKLVAVCSRLRVFLSDHALIGGEAIFTGYNVGQISQKFGLPKGAFQMKVKGRTSSRSQMQSWFIVVLVAACVLLPCAATAQGLTGTLIGTVRDEQGAVVPGGQIRVISPALIGGPRDMTTNEAGQFRFPNLTPGSYTLDIERQGFASYHEEDISIGASATLERTVVLKVAGLAESIVVEGSGSRVEARDSGFETRFGPEYLRTIPTRRFSMFDLIRAAPGVSPTSPASGTVNTVSAFGSGVSENLFLIDGTNFTCPCQGVSRAEPSVDVIQEVQIQSVGASAEYGNIQGAVFNVVTKQGGNRFAYDASYYGQSSRLTSQPVRLALPGSPATSGFERIRYRDFTTNLGGPVFRDRLWFFTGYQYLRDYDSQPGADPRFPRTYEQDKIFAKLTWQLKPNLQLVQSFHDEFWVNPQVPTVTNPFVATQRLHAHVPTMTFSHLTHTLSANTLWDVRVGRFVYKRKDDPSSGNWTIPNRSDRLTRVNSGAPQQVGGLTLLRTTAKATFSHYQREMLGASHAWKLGTEIEKGEHRQPLIIPTGIRYVDNNGQPFQTVSRGPAISGGQFISTALFVTDAVTIGERLTVNAGLRFDHSRAISHDLRAIDLQGRETDNIIRGLGTMYTWNLLSPRVGVTAKLSSDSRTILRASYGRFHQGVLTGEVSQNHPGLAPITTMAFDPATGGYTTLISVVDPIINLRIDPKTRSPRTDEYAIGVDRDLGGRLSASVAYIHKEGSDYISWIDVGGQYRDETRTAPDGRSVPVRVLANSTAARRFLVTNPEGYFVKYNGLVLAAEKRPFNGWQVYGSYTYSKAYGLQSNSGATAGGAQLSTIANAVPITFGQDPNDLTNARGRLPNDRPHLFRVMGKFDVPRTGMAIASNFQYFSGKPWAASTLIALPQGDRRILLEPRGSRRLSSQSLLDMRLSKTILTRESARIELLVDVLNVLNNKAEEELASDDLFSSNFGRPTIFADPRRAMFGVRLQLGAQ
jgi:TonB dependent receptor/Carboxypeptidase regulatory-like domain